jgi:hypothetical protein
LFYILSDPWCLACLALQSRRLLAKFHLLDAGFPLSDVRKYRRLTSEIDHPSAGGTSALGPLRYDGKCLHT